MKRTRQKHNAASKAKVALAAVRGTGRSPSWRVSSGFIRTRSTTGRSSCWMGQRVFSKAAAQRSRAWPARRRSIFCTGRSKTIFWHESSANEPYLARGGARAGYRAS
jgi:hypothetical protein